MPRAPSSPPAWGRLECWGRPASSPPRSGGDLPVESELWGIPNEDTGDTSKEDFEGTCETASAGKQSDSQPCSKAATSMVFRLAALAVTSAGGGALKHEI